MRRALVGGGRLLQQPSVAVVARAKQVAPCVLAARRQSGVALRLPSAHGLSARTGVCCSQEVCSAGSRSLSSAAAMRNDDANCYGSVVPFKMTDIGEGIKEVELLQWFVRPGDAVAQFDRVCEVQSDKATVEITSRYDGTVVALHHAVGAMVPTGATLMEIAAPAAAAAAVAPPPPASPSLSTADTAPAPPPVLTSASPTSGAAPAAAEFELAVAATADARAAQGGGGGGAAVLTTPAVRRAAREYGVDLQRLRASGPRGRVLKGDVEAYARAHRLERGAAATLEPAAAVAAAAAPSVMLNIAPAVTVRWGRLERPPLNGGSSGAAAAHINGGAHMRLNGSASTPVPAALPSLPPPPPPAVQAPARPRAAEAQAQLPPPSPAVFVAPPPHQQLQPQAPPPQQQDWQQQQQRHQQQQQQCPLSDFPAHEPSPAPAEALIPLRGMQRAMAEHMKRALQVPHMGYCDEVLMDRMAALRADIRAARGASDPAAARLSFLPIIIKATSLALARHPILNSSMAPCGTALQPHADQNIGVAMDTPRGLVVPNIKRVQTLSILEIAAELQRLQAEGAAGRLTERDLSGGTFTLSNIGTIGGTYASPVLLVPQVGIGALGRVRTLPRYDAGGALVPAPLMTVSWAADHRVVDGATLARFSNAWKGFLENPALMLAESR